MSRSKDLVSVIITTKDEESVIRRLIRSIKRQTYKYKEVIVVDNSSEDKTTEIAREMGAKVYSFGPERSRQRNFGAKVSKGKYLLVLDADMELSSKVIEDCVNKVVKEKAIGVVIPEESKWVNFWGQVKAFERSFYNEKGDPITDAARFFSKKAFNGVGGYDESITGPEDWDLPDRLRERGFKITRSSEKIFHHEQDLSLTLIFKKKFYYGLHAHKYLKKHDIPILGPKTVYFLRPLFYKSWPKLLKHPILSFALTTMLFVELTGGGLGYIVGRMRK